LQFSLQAASPETFGYTLVFTHSERFSSYYCGFSESTGIVSRDSKTWFYPLRGKKVTLWQKSDDQ